MKKITAIAYKVLYDLVVEKIYNEELTVNQQNKLKGKHDNALWDEDEIGRDGTNFFIRLFVDFPRLSRDHFWKKKGIFSPQKAFLVSFNEEILNILFEYVGISIPDSTLERTAIDEVVKAEILYKQFLMREGIDGQKHQKYDLSTESPAEVVRPNEEDSADSEDEDRSVCIKVAFNYLKAISDRKYAEAFDYLTTSYKSDFYRGNLLFFEHQFRFTSSIDIFGMSSGVFDDGASKYLHVHYREKKTIYNFPEVDAFLHTKADYIDLLKENLNQLSKRLKKMGLHGEFFSMPLHDFFKPDYAERLMINSGYDPSILKELLEEEEKFLERFCSFRFEQKDGRWLIADVTSRPTVDFVGGYRPLAAPYLKPEMTFKIKAKMIWRLLKESLGRF